MAQAKKGRTTHATGTADACACGHAVGSHDSNENCRFKNTVGGCGCSSIRTENNPSA